MYLFLLSVDMCYRALSITEDGTNAISVRCMCGKGIRLNISSLYAPTMTPIRVAGRRRVTNTVLVLP